MVKRKAGMWSFWYTLHQWDTFIRKAKIINVMTHNGQYVKNIFKEKIFDYNDEMINILAEDIDAAMVAKARRRKAENDMIMRRIITAIARYDRALPLKHEFPMAALDGHNGEAAKVWRELSHFNNEKQLY